MWLYIMKVKGNWIEASSFPFFFALNLDWKAIETISWQDSDKKANVLRMEEGKDKKILGPQKNSLK